MKYGTLKRPQTKALIDSVIESKAEWLHRRISAICEKKNGAPLSLAEYTKELLLHVFDFFHDKNPVNNINLIDNAKRLLDSTVCNISDISEKVGYSDTKYFSKLFKKITGKTVYEYRKDKHQTH